jgi:hypothetical protein
MQGTQRPELVERQNIEKKGSFALEKEPRLNSEESRKSELQPTDAI